MGFGKKQYRNIFFEHYNDEALNSLELLFFLFDFINCSEYVCVLSI